MIFASGLNIGLRHTIGVGREVISANHSISIGFDLAPVGADSFPFEALTYFSERAADRMAYLTLFPIGAVDAGQPLRLSRDDRSLDRGLPHGAGGLARRDHAAASATSSATSRSRASSRSGRSISSSPTDHVQPGFVLVGDAFATSCPAAGTGTNKVFTDVERLCNVYIPRWLATPGMGREKIERVLQRPREGRGRHASRTTRPSPSARSRPSRGSIGNAKRTAGSSATSRSARCGACARVREPRSCAARAAPRGRL